MNKTKQCAQFLKENEKPIFKEWEEKASREIEATRRASALIAQNHLPLLFENLISILENYNSEKDLEEYFNENFKPQYSKDHGRTRATTAHYHLYQVIREYSILRQVMTYILERNGLLCFAATEIINLSIEKSSEVAGQVFIDSINEVQERTMGLLAHDLRNPISTAYSAAEAAESGLVESREAFELIKRSLNRSLDLLEEILDIAQIKAGQGMTFRFKKFDLREEIKLTCKDASEIYSNKIKYKEQLESGVGHFDIISIRRVVENLITNAIKYGGMNSPVRVKLKEEDDDIILSVHNEGSYIAPENIKSIFEFLDRSDKLKNKNKSGWGLGLYLVKLVAKAHNGKAWVESSQDQGTTFFIKLNRYSHPENEVLTKLV